MVHIMEHNFTLLWGQTMTLRWYVHVYFVLTMLQQPLRSMYFIAHGMFICGIWQQFTMHILIAKLMGPTWGPPGAGRTQVGPMLAPWTLPSGTSSRLEQSGFVEPGFTVFTRKELSSNSLKLLLIICDSIYFLISLRDTFALLRPRTRK